MGLEESRMQAANPKSGGGGSDSNSGSGSGGSEEKQVSRRCLPWTSVHRCSQTEWTSGQHDALNFDHSALTCQSRLYNECFPGFCIHQQKLIPTCKNTQCSGFRSGSVTCTRRPLKRAKFSKMAEHLEYNHIPASLSSIQKFCVKSVLCYRGSLMVLHLVRNMASQFGTVDFRGNRFLGIFAKLPVEFSIEVVRGEISPDETKCILLAPAIRYRQRLQDTLLLCDLRTNEILSELLVPGGSCQFAFDPRFTSFRVALSYAGPQPVGEVNAVEEETLLPVHQLHELRQAMLLSLLDCRSWRRMGTAALGAPGQCVRRLQYSRAGHLLLAVATDDRAGDVCHCRGFGDRRRQLLSCQLVLHDSDTLTRLRLIPYFRLACPLHSCPATYCPVMSRCGSRMAFAVSPPGGQCAVLVRQLPQPPTLKAMAREVVLQIWSDHALRNRLSLPSSMMSYLRFCPEYSCAGICLLQADTDKCG